MASEPDAAPAESPDVDPKDLGDGLLTRMIPVTPPGCASCFTTIFLICTVITTAVIFVTDENHVPWWHTVSWFRIGLIVALVIAIPMVIHRSVQLWMEVDKSPFPELEYAWKAGLFALSSNGLSIQSIPVYLILGSSGERQEKAIFDASGLGMRVEGVPEGPAPIHWYANADGIYICCSDSSWTSALASLREELMLEAAGKGLPIRDTDVGAARQAPIPAKPVSSTPANEPMDAYQGTMQLDQFLVPESSETPMPKVTPDPEPAKEQNLETYTEDEFLVTPIEPVVISQQYASGSLQELQHFCKLLRRIREPVCSLNGIVTLLQLEAIHGSSEEMEELFKAIRGDLATIQHAAQTRCPVTTLIVGLEKERGFRELLRRVGNDRSIAQRFGKRFDLETEPQPAQLANLSAHVCGAFEDWCYALFREEKSLSHPGNTRLYELLAKVRLGWKTKLGEILSQTIAAENVNESESPLLYSGCYVAASGDTPDRQGFVRAFLEKLKDEQEFVEWTPIAIKEDRMRKRIFKVGLFACLGLAASLVVMVAIKVFGSAS